MKLILWVPLGKEYECCLDSDMSFDSAAVDWTPSVLTTEAWYKADSGITESGGKVSQWDDQSGNDYHWQVCLSINLFYKLIGKSC